jgi:hypothetical protein
MALTNTQTNVISKLKQLIPEQDRQLGYTNVLFQVLEYQGERWCSLWSVSVRENDMNNQREWVLWIGPRGRVIQLKQPSGPVGQGAMLQVVAQAAVASA